MAAIVRKDVEIVLTEEEKLILIDARRILKELWSDDVVEDDTAQGTITATKNPSFNDRCPSEYNGKIDAYDAAEVIEHIIDMVGAWDIMEARDNEG